MRIMLLLFAIAAEAVAPTATQRLDKGQAGPLKIKAPIESIYDIYSYGKQTEIVDLYLNEKFTPAIKIFTDDLKESPIFIVHVGWDSSFVIKSITVRSHKYRTSRGIGVGSLLSELRKIYSDLNIEVHKGDPYAVVKSQNMAFLLERNGIPQKFWFESDPKLLPPILKVKEVLIR